MIVFNSTEHVAALVDVNINDARSFVRVGGERRRVLFAVLRDLRDKPERSAPEHVSLHRRFFYLLPEVRLRAICIQ